MAKQKTKGLRKKQARFNLLNISSSSSEEDHAQRQPNGNRFTVQADIHNEVKTADFNDESVASMKPDLYTKLDDLYEQTDPDE